MSQDNGAEGLRILPLRGLPEVRPGDDLAPLLLAAAVPIGGLRDGDVLLVTHKIVAKAENCLIDLTTIAPSPFAQAFAERWGKDARQIEVVLRESARIVRMDHGVLISETRHGFICANAGIDRSNAGAADTVLTLPRDPDATARTLRSAIVARTGAAPAVIITDTFGRAWREGLTNVAIGCAGLRPLRDERGLVDADGYRLNASILAIGDELAAVSELVMGKLDRVPAAVVRGYAYDRGEGSGRDLLRSPATDMFR